MAEVSPIVKLEEILNEFYHQSTSNFRKKEIERDLINFQKQDFCLDILINHLTSSRGFTNQFLWFFSVSTIELTITKRWNSESKLMIQIRDVLWFMYVNFPLNVDAMQRDKLAQLIALTGKRQFPEEYPEYINQIMSLIKTKFILGITLLKSTFSEISSTKPDVTYQKKKSFVQGTIASLNDLMPLLNKFMTLCVCRVGNNELIVGLDIGFDMNQSLPNDDRFIYSCSELLVCIQSIFSWAPSLDGVVTSEFLNNIFELCMYTGEKFVNINVNAIMTISELFYLKRPLPQPMIIANGITELLMQKNLADSFEEYQDKLAELLRLFTNQQWNRFAGASNDNSFPAKDFLLNLFNFTFSNEIAALAFTERLSIWKPIIKSFNEKQAGRYTETIVQLISNVFKKMQFQYDSDALEFLDTEDVDENMETELQHFLNQCIEIISVAAETEPCKIFDLLNHEFNRDDGKFKIFIGLLNALPDFEKDSANVPVILDDILRYITAEPSKKFYFHCLVRDLSSFIQVMTQLSSVVLLTTDERSQSISIVIRSCLFVLKLANRKKVYLCNFNDYQITTDLVELQAQLLTSVRSLILMKSEIFEDHHEVSSIIESVTQLLLPSTCGCDEPLIIVNSAAQLMLTITSAIRPNYIMKHPFVLQLIQSDLNHQRDTSVKLLLKRIVFNCLLLPYNRIAINQTEDQEYEKRGRYLQHYVSFLSANFLVMDVNDAEKMLTIREMTKTELGDYEELLLAYEDSNTISKQILLAAIKPIIDKTVQLFQKFGKDIVIFEGIVNFYLSAIKCLQLQLGSQFVIQIIQMFLEMATAISNGNSQALNKLLLMLLFIVQQSGSTANMLMSDILKMILDDLLPQEQSQNMDISINLYTLFDAILQNHWNYFQKPSSLTCGRNHQDDLLKMFTAFGQFLVNGANNSDPNVIRIILDSLEKLHELWKLYDNALFKNLLLKSFLCTLIRMAVSPEGILFFDQIISIVFKMTERNKNALMESFVSIGYSSEVKIIQQICETSDLPTFSNSMQILVQDTIYSQFLN